MCVQGSICRPLYKYFFIINKKFLGKIGVKTTKGIGCARS
ncbi:hypothetical protein LEP1GSC166_2900 [Leptospira kirschneri]|nr:hypothetical protein LEP1GSC166_2900 [Leptospira kirschneri]